MKRLRFGVVALLLVGACSPWVLVPGTSANAIEAANPAAVRLTTTTGQTVVLTAARVVHDSVTGFDPANGRITMPLARIRLVQVRRGTPLDHWVLKRDTLVHVH